MWKMKNIDIIYNRVKAWIGELFGQIKLVIILDYIQM
jgi:hypothetical protein